MMEFETIEITQHEPTIPVFHLYLNLPSTRNALTLALFTELPTAITYLDSNPSVHTIVLSARGPHFCSGIDISALQSQISSTVVSDPARSNELLRRRILDMQAAITSIERCRKPVIAAVHGGCVGGGVDLVTACDLRFCSEDAWFEVKEVDLGITADLGTLQRLPGIVGFGNSVEMAMTGRRVKGAEAKRMGLVTRVFESKEDLDKEVYTIAKSIAEKSLLALVGTKTVLQKSKELTVEQGLDYVATWNAAMLQSDDLKEAITARLQKRKPTFSKL